MSITYQIRKWAAVNKHAAQGLIALSTIALFFLGHVLGVLAEILGWDPYAMFLIGAGTGILAWTLAPRKGEDFPIRYSYARQRVAVVIMLTSMTLGIGGWAICFEEYLLPNEKSIQTAKPVSEAAIGATLFQGTQKTSKISKPLSDWFRGGISKRTLKHTRRIIKARLGAKPTTGQLLLHIGYSILIAWGVMAITIPLSCYFYCYGYQALAVIAGAGGLVLLIYLVVTLFKNLKQSSLENGARKKVKPSSS